MILTPQSHGSDGALDRVGVELDTAVIEEPVERLSFLKTSSAAEILAFQTAGDYRLRHANDHQYPRRALSI